MDGSLYLLSNSLGDRERARAVGGRQELPEFFSDDFPYDVPDAHEAGVDADGGSGSDAGETLVVTGACEESSLDVGCLGHKFLNGRRRVSNQAAEDLTLHASHEKA